MEHDGLIQILLSCIGALLLGFVGYFFKVNETATKEIKDSVHELKNMFVNHVTDNEIHMPRNRKKD